MKDRQTQELPERLQIKFNENINQMVCETSRQTKTETRQDLRLEPSLKQVWKYFVRTPNFWKADYQIRNTTAIFQKVDTFIAHDEYNSKNQLYSLEQHLKFSFPRPISEVRDRNYELNSPTRDNITTSPQFPSTGNISHRLSCCLQAYSFLPSFQITNAG